MTYHPSASVFCHYVFLQFLVDVLIGNVAYLLQVVHGVDDTTSRVGVDLLHKRQQSVADAVALAVVLAVGRIGHTAQAIVIDIADDVVAGEAEQRAHYPCRHIVRHDASEPVDASSTHQVHQNCLDAVVEMMAHCNEALVVRSVAHEGIDEFSPPVVA